MTYTGRSLDDDVEEGEAESDDADGSSKGSQIMLIHDDRLVRRHA